MRGSLPGERRGGRHKGVPNKITALARDSIAMVAKGLGGHKRMIAWAKEAPDNETAFWTKIYPRLLPVQVTGEGGGALQVFFTSDDAKLL